MQENQANPDPMESIASDIKAAAAGIVAMAAVLFLALFQYLGPILKPLFVAAFLYYLVTPAAEMLITRGVRRWLAYLTAVLILAAVMTSFGFVVYANIRAVEQRFPFYRDRITEWTDTLAKETRVVGKPREPLLKGLDTLKDEPDEKEEPDPESKEDETPPATPDPMEESPETQAELETPAVPETAPAAPPPAAPAATVPEEIPPAGSGPLGDLFNVSVSDLIAWGFGTAVGFIGNMVAVLFYLTFIILEAHKFPSRLERAFSDETTERFMRFGKQVTNSVRQYLVIKTLISLGTGACAALIMVIFGVEFWPLWAILTFLFNYVPYVGSLAATAFPILVAFVQFTNPWLAGILGILLTGNQQVWGNLIEPQVMGKHLNISPLALLIFVAYWGWLWGIVGMVLSVPLAVFLKMLLNFFPRTRKIAVLMSAD